jgi:hypothetical protein
VKKLGGKEMLSINQRLLGLAIAASIVSINVAHAVECAGTAIRKFEEPVTVHKNNDESFILQVKSTGVSTQTSPSRSDVWQHCTGLWTVNVDKSGSGFGTCYSLDKKTGDYYLAKWEGSNEKGKSGNGTWVRIAGSGKYQATIGSKGTWSSGARFPENFRLNHWKGDCIE